MDLTGREGQFLEDIRSVRKWNGKFYETDYFDGTMWTFSLAYDNKSISASGMNGYPQSFLRFLQVLHEKYGLPKAACEDEKTVMEFVKETAVYKR